jgi:phosphosulfolactate synthase (CoM biosynthesis protein A)
MYFGFCFSAFNPDEVISMVQGNTIDKIISGIEADEIIFEDAFDNGQIMIIEGETVNLRRVSTYEID